MLFKRECCQTFTVYCPTLSTVGL